ncbi:MAG: hypothetical protein ACLSFT_03940 [Ruminococcus callidus]
MALRESQGMFVYLFWQKQFSDRIGVLIYPRHRNDMAQAVYGLVICLMLSISLDVLLFDMAFFNLMFFTMIGIAVHRGNWILRFAMHRTSCFVTKRLVCNRNNCSELIHMGIARMTGCAYDVRPERLEKTNDNCGQMPAIR